MFQYRQVLRRLRAGDYERDVARAGLMGRQKLAQVRSAAQFCGWLDPSVDLPTDEELAQAFAGQRRVVSTISSVEHWRDLVAQ